MSVLDLRCQFIQNDAGKHSFEIVHTATGRTIFRPDDWWDTREAVVEAVASLRGKFIDNLNKLGLSINPGEGNNAFANVSIPTTVEERIPILTALAVQRNTGKFGYCIITGNGEVLRRPQEWFDTADQAYNHCISNRDVIRDEIAKMIKERGIEGDLVFTDDPPTRNDFKPEGPHIDCNDATKNVFEEAGAQDFFEQLAQLPDDSADVVRRPYTPRRPQIPRGFDPTAN